ncbi:MAG: GntR family transcriptional regulator [Jatrophihabitantaceae bacterium]
MAGIKDAGLTKQEQVYRYVRERILSGAYGPGYRVVITQVARELSVSALPVREAIRRLEAEDLIEFRPNEGARVAAPRPHFFEDDLAVLAVLDGYATSLAAPHLAPVRLRRLGEITDEMTSAMQRVDTLTFGRLEQDFHGVVYDMCPNVSLATMLHELADRIHAIRRTAFVLAPYRGSQSIEEHRRLVALISEGGTAREIESAARDHLLAALHSFREWHEHTR